MDRLLPLTTAIAIAESMDDATARNRVLEEVAKVRFRLGHLDDALSGLQDAPNERTVLRQLAIDAANKNDADSVTAILRRLIDLDTKAAPLVGRLASVLIDGGNPDGAVQVVRCVEHPFDGNRACYDFIVKLLQHDRFDAAKNLTDTIEEAALRDWVLLAFARRYAELGRHSEVEAVVERFSLPEKRSWAFFEAARCSLAPGEFFRRAGAILETLDIDQSNAEAAAIQRRIVGKALWNADEHEAAKQLLESSEAAFVVVEDTFRRLRAQCFLAKVLREIGELDSVRNYLDISSLKSESFTPTQRSELLQWLAEASGSADDWTLAVQEMLEDKNEIQRSRRIVEILRRFSYTKSEMSPTDDPDLDAVLLSGEEFEERYYSPFTIEGCDC